MARRSSRGRPDGPRRHGLEAAGSPIAAADDRLAEDEMLSSSPIYEVAAVLRERGKPPVAYMVDADRNYVGGAFVSGLNRDMRERLWQRVTAKAGPPAKGL